MDDLARKVAARYLRATRAIAAKINYKPAAQKVLDAFRREDYDVILAFLNQILRDTGTPKQISGWGISPSVGVPVPALDNHDWFQALGPRMQSRYWNKANRAFSELYWTVDSFRQRPPEKKTPESVEFHIGLLQKYLKELIWLGTILVDEGSGEESFKHGPFTIIPMKGVSKSDLAKCLKTLDEVIRLCRRKFPQVLYGKVYINNTISDRRQLSTLAHYMVDTDVLTLATIAPREIQTYLHELGHRYDSKFLRPDQRKYFRDLSKGAVTGSPIPVTNYGGTHPDENFAEGFAYFVMGKPLPHEAMQDFFEDL